RVHLISLLPYTTALPIFALNCFSYLYFQAIRQTSGRAIGVVEIGIGQPKQMRRYAEAIRPDVAVVTCVGLEHEKSFPDGLDGIRSEEHTSELQSRENLVC